MPELIVTPLGHVDIDQVMLELKSETESLPFGAIRTIQQHPPLFIPRLIDAIENAVNLHEEGRCPEGESHFFALFLLTEFRAMEAWPSIRRVLLLPDEGSYLLFGETGFECLGRILALYSARDIENLDELLSHSELDPFVQIAVTESYFYLVRDGYMSRDEAVGRLQRMFRAAITDADGQTATERVIELAKYAPHEALEEIRSAYRDDLIDPTQISLSDVEQCIGEGEDGFQEKLSELWPTGILDTVDELTNWAKDREEFERAFERDEEENDPAYQSKFRQVMTMLQRAFEGFEPIDLQTLDTGEPEFEVGTIIKSERRVGRNELCPCGSGKKYKKCCSGS